AILDAVCARQRVSVQAGDILLVYTGWMKAFRRPDGDLGTTMVGAGLAPGKEIPAWLWGHRVAAVAADNMGVEAYPWEPGRGRSLHPHPLTSRGTPRGALFSLHDLPEAGAPDGKSALFFVSVPLNPPGGTAPPANAVAIK